MCLRSLKKEIQRLEVKVLESTDFAIFRSWAIKAQEGESETFVHDEAYKSVPLDGGP